jgi:hypothetical protein
MVNGPGAGIVNRAQDRVYLCEKLLKFMRKNGKNQKWEKAKMVVTKNPSDQK